LTTLIVGLASITVSAGNGSKLNKENKPYAYAVIRTISEWDEKEISQRVSSEFKATAKDDYVSKRFLMFRRLGNPRKHKGSNRRANISVTTEYEKVISGDYVTAAEFEAGRDKAFAD
jgi:hypothetical protein